jgi:hypothetical protein
MTQGCQMVSFQTKYPNLGKFILEGLRLEKLIYFMDILNNLRAFMIFYDIRYILCPFGTFFQSWYSVPRKIWQLWKELGAP